MKLEQSFEVEAPLERVWQALIDVERVAPCLPGASVTGRNDDGTYSGTFTIKIGPTTASYAGKLELAEIDESGHRATLKADGTDKRGQGGANATIVSTVSGGNGSTKVEVSTDYRITGRLARFGRGGMIEDISERLLREFATRLQQSLGGPGEAPAEAGGSQEPATAVQAPAPEAEPERAPEGEAPAPADAPAVAQAQGPPPPYAPPPPRIQEPAAPLDAGSLVGGVLVERLRRNPAPVAFLAGLLLAIALLRRRR